MSRLPSADFQQDGPLRHCIYCESPCGSAVPGSAESDDRQAYDPQLGRLWDICPVCGRWNPVPLDSRWDAMERLELAVRSHGKILLETPGLTLFDVGDSEVVRVGQPPFVSWGASRYGTRLPRKEPRRGFLTRVLESLPPLPLEGYDPYGLTGPLGGVAGKAGPSEWLASPFMARAPLLTLNFALVPFAPSCPSCSLPMPLNPWDFEHVTLRVSNGRPSIEARCGHCKTQVLVDLRSARPAIRRGLALVDSDPAARALGESAGARVDAVGGPSSLLDVLGRVGVELGALDPIERLALGIALDYEAESEALEDSWREAEEITRIIEGDLTGVPEFQSFQERVLRGGSWPEE